MDQITAITHQAGFASAPCAWLAINGIPIEKWWATELDHADAVSLGLAQIWLLDEEEDKLAWSRIMPGVENSSTVVPILVCSDDMDFDCTVIVVEQKIVEDTVQWLRWGFSASGGLQVGISTIWEHPKSVPFAAFDRKEFETSLQNFKNMIPAHQQA